MNAVRQRLRWSDRVTGARTRLTADCSITVTLSVVPNPLESPLAPQQTYKTPLSVCMRSGYRQVNIDPRIVSGQVAKEVLLQTVQNFKNYIVAKKWY